MTDEASHGVNLLHIKSLREQPLPLKQDFINHQVADSTHRLIFYDDSSGNANMISINDNAIRTKDIPTNYIQVEDLSGKVVRTIPFHKMIENIAVSHDGKLLAMSGTNIITSGGNTFYNSKTPQDSKFLPSVNIYDLSSGKSICDFPCEETGELVFSNDSSKIYDAEGDSRYVHCWDIRGNKLVWEYRANRDNYINSIAVNPKITLLALFDRNNITYLNSLTGNYLHSSFPLKKEQSFWESDQPISFSPDGKTLISQGESFISLWHVPQVN